MIGIVDEWMLEWVVDYCLYEYYCMYEVHRENLSYACNGEGGAQYNIVGWGCAWELR